MTWWMGVLLLAAFVVGAVVGAWWLVWYVMKDLWR